MAEKMLGLRFPPKDCHLPHHPQDPPMLRTRLKWKKGWEYHLS
uniref:Uncharacterized protein n=1 Tax=Rhizophora mucronata TaxID=61149 RepID=A0A2P2QEN1_RHIMU